MRAGIDDFSTITLDELQFLAFVAVSVIITRFQLQVFGKEASLVVATMGDLLWFPLGSSSVLKDLPSFVFTQRSIKSDYMDVGLKLVFLSFSENRDLGTAVPS